MNKKVGRKTLVIVLVSLGLILGMGFGLNAALGEGFLSEKPITSLDTVSPTATATLEWMYTAPEDIWELTPPPDWTPPAMIFEKRTPHPSVLETNFPNPTPTFLPERGIQLSLAVAFPFSQWNLGEPQAFELENDTLAFSAYRPEDDTISLVLLNLNTEKFGVITSVVHSHVDILHLSDKYLLWSTRQVNKQDTNFYLYSFDTKDTTLLLGGIKKPFGLYGSNVIWHRYEKTSTGDQVDIWGYNVETHEEFQIIQRPANQVGVGLAKDWVVYFDALDNNELGTSLNVFNINTQQDINIGYLDNPLDYPLRYAVSDSWIGWARDAELHFYNLETKQSHIVKVTACPSPLMPWNSIGYLDISGNLAVLSCGQKMGYDITRDVFFSLPVQPTSNQSLLAWDLSADRLVWMTDNGMANLTEREMYVAQIEYEK